MAEYITDEIDFAAYLRETDAQAKVKNAGVWVDSMKKRLRMKASEVNILLPWVKSQDDFAFRMGEVTIWGGVNGHGKSLVTSQVALSLMG